MAAVVDAPDNAAPGDDPPLAPSHQGFVAAVTRRPVRTTALLGVVVGAYNLWWVANHRFQGGFDGDETSYLATTLRFRRILDTEGLGAMLEAARHTFRNGPLVPFSAAFLVRDGSPISSAMSVQPIFHLIIAVAVAATVRRLAGDRPALVAGIVVLGLPGLLVSVRTFQLVMAVTASMAVAVWALVASDRGRRTGYLVVFGAAVGAMLLSRTMSVSYVPGLVIAAAVIAGGSRRGRAGLVLAAGVTLVVAAPWWIAEWDNSIYRYLFRYGYGSGSDPLGPEWPPLRVLVRLGLITTDVRPLMAFPAAILFVSGLLAARRSLRAGGAKAFFERNRELIGVWSVVGVGWIALLSSSNIGTYFQLPLETIAVIGLASLPLRSRLRGRIGIWLIGVAALNVVLLSHWSIGASIRSGGATLSVPAFGGVETSQSIDYENGDARFRPMASDRERRAAMRDWARAQNETAAAVDSLTPPGATVMQTFLGDIRLYQATTLALAEELTGKGVSPWEAPTATSTTGDGTVDLSPTASGDLPRVLVAVRATTYTDQEGAPADPVLAEARSEGWTLARRVPLPDGGSVEIYTHPDNAAFHARAS